MSAITASRKLGAMLRWRLTLFGFSGCRGDAMQHQDGADAADKRPGQRCEAGIAGDVERQFPDCLPTVDHSFTFCA